MPQVPVHDKTYYVGFVLPTSLQISLFAVGPSTPDLCSKAHVSDFNIEKNRVFGRVSMIAVAPGSETSFNTSESYASFPPSFIDRSNNIQLDGLFTIPNEARPTLVGVYMNISFTNLDINHPGVAGET